jgi:hypothetical protein
VNFESKLLIANAIGADGSHSRKCLAVQKKNITPLYNPSNVTIAAHDPSNKSINNRPQNVKNGQMPRKKLRRSSLGGGLVFGWWQIRESHAMVIGTSRN